MTTLLSFRTEDDLAAELDTEAASSGCTRSELLNQALRALLYRRRCERDAERYRTQPLTDDEIGLWPTEVWPDDWDAVDVAGS